MIIFNQYTLSKLLIQRTVLLSLPYFSRPSILIPASSTYPLYLMYCNGLLLLFGIRYFSVGVYLQIL